MRSSMNMLIRNSINKQIVRNLWSKKVKIIGCLLQIFSTNQIPSCVGMLLALKEKKQFEETSSDICQFLLVEKCLLS